MDPLKRNTPGVRATNHEDRIQVLERRFNPPSIPTVIARVTSSFPTITGDTELEWGSVITNDEEIYAMQAGDDAGINILQDGIYEAELTVRTNQPAAAKSILLKTGTVSGGSSGDFGSDWSHVGDGQSQASLSDVTAVNTISKSVLNEIAVQGYFGVDPTDPVRVAVLFNHLGTNFTLSFSALVIKQIMAFPGDATVLL